MRFTDFLKTSVLLFGGAATALAVVALAGASARDDTTLIYVALGWWVAAAGLGLWLGRRAAASAGIARLLASARTSPVLPELEPGTILMNRLWTLALVTVGGGAVAFLIPQVPAAGAGYALIGALGWRKQPGAVAAIEGRDGIRYYIEKTSPLKPTQLLRTPGFRKVEPVPEQAEPEPAR